MAAVPLSSPRAKTRPDVAYLWAALAVGMWAVVPLLRVAADMVPPLQMAAIALASAAGLGLATAGRATAGRVVPAPPGGRRVVVAAGLCLAGGLGFYLAALGLAPAAEVALISYVWPILFSLAGSALARQRPSGRGLAGAALAFAATAPLLLAGGGGATEGAGLGYVLAFLSAATWAGFILLLARHPDLTGPRMPAVCAVAAVAAGAAHLAVEATVMPPAEALVVAVVLGLGPYGLAFVLWGRALARAGEAPLTPLAYAVPVLSAALAVAAGLAVADAALVLAAVGVVGGAGLARDAAPARAVSAS